MEKIVLIGGGGHCKVVMDAIMAAGAYEIAGVVDPRLEVGSDVLGVPVVGDDSALAELMERGVKKAAIGVGSVGDPSLRKEIYARVRMMGFEFPSIVHPKAVVARDVEIGEGAFLAASATVNPGTRIGVSAIINTSSSIDHDCSIGDFAHIAPGAVLSGGVEVGDETHIGTGAKVSHYVKIPGKTKIKAGSLVYTDGRGKMQVRTMIPVNLTGVQDRGEHAV